jgi:hypothetical protein
VYLSGDGVEEAEAAAAGRKQKSKQWGNWTLTLLSNPTSDPKKGTNHRKVRGKCAAADLIKAQPAIYYYCY